MKNNILTGSILLSSLVLLVSLFNGCDNSTSPSENQQENNIESWLWAFDNDNETVTLYDTYNGAAETTYAANAFPMMHCFTAGPSIKPTLWMAKTSTVYGFTTGFDLSQGNTSKELPVPYAVIQVGNNPVHVGSSPSGDMVTFANDGDMTVSVIDVASKSVVSTVSHGSGHSSALHTGEYLITTAATASGEKWAKINDIAKDSVLDSLTIGAGPHGDSYYDAGKKAFIACADGIYVINVAARTVSGSIVYTQPGRTNFLYHSHDNKFAAGLHKTTEGTSDKILLLNMQNETLEYITISGAVLTWNISTGQFALSSDGTVAVISDNTTANIYHITLATKAVKTLAAPSPACAIATNTDGTIVWAFKGSTISRINVAENQIKETFPVTPNTDWIFVTSAPVNSVH